MLERVFYPALRRHLPLERTKGQWRSPSFLIGLGLLAAGGVGFVFELGRYASSIPHAFIASGFAVLLVSGVLSILHHCVQLVSHAAAERFLFSNARFVVSVLEGDERIRAALPVHSRRRAESTWINSGHLIRTDRRLLLFESGGTAPTRLVESIPLGDPRVLSSSKPKWNEPMSMPCFLELSADSSAAPHQLVFAREEESVLFERAVGALSLIEPDDARGRVSQADESGLSISPASEGSERSRPGR